MQIDLKAIKTKAQALLTPPNFLGATTIALLVIINWDVLLLRYRQFVEWAPWVPPAVAQAYSILISIVMAAALHKTISFLLELVYFGPLKRLQKLEQQDIPKSKGQAFCHNMVLSILVTDVTDSQRRELKELTDFVEQLADGPMKEGAVEALGQLPLRADPE